MPKPRNGERGFYPDSSDEWIDVDRLREVAAEIEAAGGTAITPVDLLNRLAIGDDELELLRQVRRLTAAVGKPAIFPGAADPHAPGRRTAKGDA